MGIIRQIANGGVLENKRVIIIGAGIAGPALALQLKKIGITAEVYEARKESDYGQGVFLGITPNGLNVLKGLIDIQTLREEYTSGRMFFYNSSNRKIATLDTNYQLQQYGAETIQVRRSKISNELRKELIIQSIPIHYGKKLVCLKEAGDCITIEFEDGSRVIADYVFACDGVFSACRRLLFPDLPRPVYTKQLSAAGFTFCKNIRSTDGIKMIFGHEGFFAYAVSNTGEIWWFSNFFRSAEPQQGELNGLLREIKASLVQLHRSDPQEIVEIITATDKIFTYPIYEYPSLVTWFSGRCCLLGDAAHATAPHIGQGASMALEDSVVLSGCIKAVGLNARSFSLFQDYRRQRVEKLIKTARKIGKKKTGSPAVTSFFRDLFLSFFIKGEIKKMDWVYRYKAAIDDFSEYSR